MTSSSDSDSDNDLSHPSRLGDCEVCGSKEAIYTCPKCEVKTCCLECVRIHKKELECSGVRDRTKFIYMKDFTDTDLLSDYRLLEECARFVYAVKKDKKKKFTRIDKDLPIHLHKLRLAARKRGTVLQFLAQNFTRHKVNTTRYLYKTNQINWRVEWVFPNVETKPLKFVDEICLETKKLSELLDKYLNPDTPAFEGSKDLVYYKSIGFSGVKILLKAEKLKSSAKKFFELDTTESLAENLSGKCIVEFPIIFVVLKDHAYNFEIVTPALLEDDTSTDEENLVEYILRRKKPFLRKRTDHFLWDEVDFVARFRLSKRVAKYLVTILESTLKRNTNRNQSMSVADQLLIALQFYASGSFQRCVGDAKGVHKSTVCRAIRNVSIALARLRSNYIYMPRNEEINMVIENFHKISSFPKVIGAIDCTHVPIASPGGNEAEYFRNRKDYFSINVQVICDADNYIRNIVARWPGGSHDSHIFNSSNIKGRLEDGEFGNCWLLGDRGYALKPYLLTPLTNPITRGEKLYNESHIRTRNVVERTFGCWKRRFPAIGSKLRTKIDRIQPIIVATAVLHNICKKYNEIQPPDLVPLVSEIENENSNIFNFESHDTNRRTLVDEYFSRM